MDLFIMKVYLDYGSKDMLYRVLQLVENQMQTVIIAGL